MKKRHCNNCDSTEIKADSFRDMSLSHVEAFTTTEICKEVSRSMYFEDLDFCSLSCLIIWLTKQFNSDEFDKWIINYRKLKEERSHG